VAAGGLLDRFAGWPPGREGDHAVDLRVTGGAQRGPTAHGVAEQDGRYGTGEFGEGVQRAKGVPGRVGTAAVPAAEAVTDLGDQHVVVRQPGDHRADDRAHAQRGQLPGAGGAFTGLLAAVQDQDGGLRAWRTPS
jgi:hypothetical protein